MREQGQRDLLGRFDHERVPAHDGEGQEPERHHRGKLNGAIAAHTPIGCRKATQSSPAATFSRLWPISIDGAPQATSTHSIPRRTLPATRRAFCRARWSRAARALEMLLEQRPEAKHRPGPSGGGVSLHPGKRLARPRRRRRRPPRSTAASGR